MFLRLTLLAVGLIASYVGSLCFQSGSGPDMAVGGGSILIGVLCFFFLGKGLWRFLGCMSTFVLMAVIVGVIFFFISGSDMLKGVTAKFLNKSEPAAPAAAMPMPAPLPAGGAVAPAPGTQPTTPAAPATLQPNELVGMPPTAGPQPMQMPQVVTGRIESIVSADVFRIGKHTIRLYGIASPLIDQNCIDQNGHSYECGYVAARMLRDFISGDEVSCRIMNINAQNELMAACSVGTFDIGAAMVEEGWAIALPAVTQIYIPYQTKAQQAKNGLWAGQFQMPWEWQVEQQQIQKQKATIKVPKLPSPNAKKKDNIFDFF